MGTHFGPAKVVKERVGGGRGAEFVAFDCTSQEKAAHGHVVHAVQEVPFWAPFDAVFDTSCPGNERCAVKSFPVRCRFRFSSPDQASRHLAASRP